MSAPRSSSGKRRSKSRGYPNPQMRVSDADRAEVADLLSQHYSDGRLDQAEYNERLDQAMKAKTQSDLSGLFDDLPVTEADESATGAASSGGPAPSAVSASWRHDSGQRPALQRVLFLGLVAVVAVVIGHAIAHFYVPWLLIGLLAALWLIYGPHQHRHR